MIISFFPHSAINTIELILLVFISYCDDMEVILNKIEEQLEVIDKQLEGFGRDRWKMRLKNA